MTGRWRTLCAGLPLVLPACEGGAPARTVLAAHGLALAEIPAGSFTMGSPPDELFRMRDETAHPVRLTRPFLLGVTEVTRDLYLAVMSEDPSTFSDSGSLPVQSVSWRDAVVFCNALSQMDGRAPAYVIRDGSVRWRQAADGYRLPTEAEWEYAARASGDGLYAGGDDLERLGWFSGDGGQAPREVATRQPNAWGLYDMSGNVREWVWDAWEEYAPAGVTDPVGPDAGRLRVVRGGAWDALPRDLRVASRDAIWTTYVDEAQGFRVAASLD